MSRPNAGVRRSMFIETDRAYSADVRMSVEHLSTSNRFIQPSEWHLYFQSLRHGLIYAEN